MWDWEKSYYNGNADTNPLLGRLLKIPFCLTQPIKQIRIRVSAIVLGFETVVANTKFHW